MKKICFIITSRAQYARNKLLLRMLNNDPDFDLKIILGASAVLSKYGEVASDLKKEGFNSVEELYVNLEGGNNISMAKTTGLSIFEFTNTFQRINPEMVIVMGDRFEVLAAATAAAYMNIVIIHIEGGDASGTIDESVRHAVTKLSHIHFTTNDVSKSRLLRMGEDPEYVYNVGSLDVEFLNYAPNLSVLSFVNQVGVGAKIDLSQPFIVVIQHPVTTGENNLKNIQATLVAVYELGVQAVWFWPNADAGESDMSRVLRTFRENHNNYNIRFVINLPTEQFINLLKRASCLAGNSSAGIKECSFLGVPVVNIGSRQQNRMAAENVVHTSYDAQAIKEAISLQMKHGRYPQSRIYAQADTSKKIVEILKKARPPIQKRFFD